MKARTASQVAILSLTVGIGQVWADDADSSNPYITVVARNVFGLKPIPPPPPPPEPPKPPTPPITLNGITTILGNKRALISYQPPPKPGEPAKPMSLIIGEGEQDGDITVDEIDVTAGTVKGKAFGEAMNLNFKENAAKIPSGAPPMPAGVVPPSAITAPPAGQNPFVPNPGMNNKTIPNRALRVPNSSAPGATGGSGTTGTGASVNPQAFQGIGPNANLRIPEATRTPEEDAILIEAERERNRNNPNYPPLPPTPLTSQEDLRQIMAPGWNPQQGQGQGQGGQGGRGF